MPQNFSPTLPVYLVCDVSLSMNNVVAAEDRTGSPKRRIDILNKAICDLVVKALNSPKTTVSPELSIISFNNKAVLNLPLSPIGADIEFEPLETSGTTSYKVALEMLEERLDADDAKRSRRSFRPVVFFLTDGHPNCEPDTEWVTICERLAKRSAPFSLPPRIIPCPIGEYKKTVLDQLTWSYGTPIEDFTAQILSDSDNISTTIENIFNVVASTMSPGLANSVISAVAASTSYAETVKLMDDTMTNTLYNATQDSSFDDLLDGL